MHVRFTAYCVPVAQPRQRHSVYKNKEGKAQIRNYTPEDHPVQEFKAGVRLAAKIAYHGPVIASVIGIVAVFVMPRPKRLRWKNRPMPRCLHSVKPDVENIAKALFDALTGILWVDDAQITHANITKVYADGKESPCVIVEVCDLETV